MLSTIAAAIEARLISLGCFKTVEQSITKRALSAPPSAVFYLAGDKANADKPSVARDLDWDVVILTSSLGADQGQAKALECLDAVRDGFSNWQATATGVMPATVPAVQFEGIEDTVLVYVARISMRAFPQTFH
jgi:hypothetical protein